MKFDGRYEVTSPGFRPFASVGFVTRGDREGYEIDARVRHTQTIVTAGTRRRRHAGHRAHRVGQPIVDVVWTRTKQYLSVPARRPAQSQTESVAAGVRPRPTPLTTMLITAGLRPRSVHAPASEGCRQPSSCVNRSARYRSSGHRRCCRWAFYRSRRAMSTIARLPRADRIGASALRAAGRRAHRRRCEARRGLLLRSRSSPTTSSRVAASPSRSGCSGRSRCLGSASGGRFATSASAGTSFDGRREVTTSLGGGIGIQIQSQMRFALTYEHTRTDLDRTGGPQLRAHAVCSGRSSTDSNCENCPPPRSRARGRSGILERWSAPTTSSVRVMSWRCTSSTSRSCRAVSASRTTDTSATRSSDA